MRLKLIGKNHIHPIEFVIISVCLWDVQGLVLASMQELWFCLNKYQGWSIFDSYGTLRKKFGAHVFQRQWVE